MENTDGTRYIMHKDLKEAGLQGGKAFGDAIKRRKKKKNKAQ